MREEILSRVSAAIVEVCEYRDSYNSYAYLWVDDRQEFLQQFLLYGHMLTQEEIEAAGKCDYLNADLVSSLLLLFGSVLVSSLRSASWVHYMQCLLSTSVSA